MFLYDLCFYVNKLGNWSTKKIDVVCNENFTKIARTYCWLFIARMTHPSSKNAYAHIRY